MGRPINKKFIGNTANSIDVTAYRRNGSTITDDDTFILSQKSTNRFILKNSNEDWEEIFELVAVENNQLQDGQFNIATTNSNDEVSFVSKLFNNIAITSDSDRKKWTVSNIDTVGTDLINSLAKTIVFGLLGQSNMVGLATNDGGTSYPAGTQEYNGLGLSAASGPLTHLDGPGSGEPSIGLAFAIAYVQENPNDTIVLVPCADQGTGFANNNWNPGDPQYNAAVSRINQCMSENPEFIFGGFLWHQGESDGVNNASATYQSSLTSMVSSLRTTGVTVADASTPFVCGDLLPSFNLGEVAQIKAILNDSVNFIDYCGFAPSTGLTGSDDRHFDAASLRTLGQRYYTAYLESLQDLPVAPGQVQNLIAISGDEQISLAWDQTASAASYNILRSTVDGGPYTFVSTSANTTFIDIGLTNGITYYYVIEAQNAAGTGPQSTQSFAIPAIIQQLSVLNTDYRYIGDASVTNYTASNMTTTDGNPHIIVVHGTNGSGSVPAQSVTVNGSPATLLVQSAASAEGTNSIWLINSVSGTTNDVTVTYPSGQAFNGLSVNALNAIPSVVDTATDNALSGRTTETIVLDTQEDGLVFAAAVTRGTSTVPDYDFANGDSGVSVYSEFPSGAAPLTQSMAIQPYNTDITDESVTINFASASNGGIFVAVSLGI